MNKFRGPEDANYRLVQNVIKDFVEKASDIVRQWFNACPHNEYSTTSNDRIQPGDFLVHFAGVPDREKMMTAWCHRSNYDTWLAPCRTRPL
jgi:hypothetical protein